MLGTVLSSAVNKLGILSALMKFLFLGRYICVLVADSEEQGVNSV